jgi:hypothetical protein
MAGRILAAFKAHFSCFDLYGNCAVYILDIKSGSQYLNFGFIDEYLERMGGVFSNIEESLSFHQEKFPVVFTKL